MANSPYGAARLCSHSDRAEWLRLRLALWPDADASNHLADMDLWLAKGGLMDALRALGYEIDPPQG